MFLHLILLTNMKIKPDDLNVLCLADFASNYVRKKSGDVPVKSDDIKSYTHCSSI